MDKRDGLVIVAVLLWLLWPKTETDTDVVLTPTEPGFEDLPIEDESGVDATGDPQGEMIPGIMIP